MDIIAVSLIGNMVGTDEKYNWTQKERQQDTNYLLIFILNAMYYSLPPHQSNELWAFEWVSNHCYCFSFKMANKRRALWSHSFKGHGSTLNKMQSTMLSLLLSFRGLLLCHTDIQICMVYGIELAKQKVVCRFS